MLQTTFASESTNSTAMFQNPLFPPRLGNLSILGTNENYFESYSTFKFYKEQKWH